MSHVPDTGPDRARALFARAAADLDHGMAFRLRRARRQAQQPRRPAFALRGRLLPAGLAAALGLALGLALWAPGAGPAPDAVSELTEQQEIDLLLAGDDDPAMYAWLADAPVATGRR